MNEENRPRDKVEIYTDGSCLGNPGPGGWAAIMICRGVEKQLSGGHTKTTNNRMELMAVIKALEALKRPCDVTITSDSAYVVNAVTKGWLHKWFEDGSIKGRPNNDLWGELLYLLDKHNIKFKWIKGHDGHEYNELCDKLAVEMANKANNSSIDAYHGVYDGDKEILEAEFESEMAALEWVANHAVKMESIEDSEYGVILTYSRRSKLGNSKNKQEVNKKTDGVNKTTDSEVSQFEIQRQKKRQEEEKEKAKGPKEWVVSTIIDGSELFITPKGTAFIESEANRFTKEAAELKAKALTKNSRRGYTWSARRVKI